MTLFSFGSFQVDLVMVAASDSNDNDNQLFIYNFIYQPISDGPKLDLVEIFQFGMQSSRCNVWIGEILRSVMLTAVSA